MQAIKVKNLNRSFTVNTSSPGFLNAVKSLVNPKTKTIDAVKDVSFSINHGEMVGFIGPNGAGKTTTLKMLSGLLYPTSGTISVLGYTPSKRQHEYLKQISLIMGNRNQLWSDLPVIDTFNLNKSIYEIPQDTFSEVLNELTEILEVQDILDQQVRKLSLGQRMRCELIAALLHTPKILFLDEPTLGLDILMQRKMREFIKNYNQKYNSTILLTSHYMDDVKEICKRIIIINHGQLIYDDHIDNLTKTYSKHKFLIPIFNSQVTESDLENIGEVVSFTYPKAIIKVEKHKVNEAGKELLSRFDLDDLDINEPSLESIISDIFVKSDKNES